MIRIIIVIAWFSSFSVTAADSHSGWPTLSRPQLYGFIIIANSLLYYAEAAPITPTQEPLLSDQFIIGSVWAGNVYGILDIIGWLLDWVAGYRYYAKEETKEVKLLRERRKVLNEDLQKLELDKIAIASSLCDEIIKYIKEKKDLNTQEKINNILELITITTALLNEEPGADR